MELSRLYSVHTTYFSGAHEDSLTDGFPANALHRFKVLMSTASGTKRGMRKPASCGRL